MGIIWTNKKCNKAYHCKDEKFHFQEKNQIKYFEFIFSRSMMDKYQLTESLLILFTFIFIRLNFNDNEY